MFMPIESQERRLAKGAAAIVAVRLWFRRAGGFPSSRAGSSRGCWLAWDMKVFLAAATIAVTYGKCRPLSGCVSNCAGLWPLLALSDPTPVYSRARHAGCGIPHRRE